MSKQFGGVDNLLKKKHKQEQERHRANHLAEVEADRWFKAQLQIIKDKLDLFGEEALTEKERAIVKDRRGFFFPGEE